MDRRYNPSCPPPVRPQRSVEGWMVAAVVLGLVIGSMGLVVKHVVLAFTDAADRIETPVEEAR